MKKNLISRKPLFMNNLDLKITERHKGL